MKHYSGLLVALALLVPSLASAQKKPASTMHTRSAEVYLNGARKEQVATDRTRLYEQALGVTLEGVQKDPENPRIWLLMAEAQLGLGRLAAADSAFDRAEQLYPGYKAEVDPVRENAWVDAYNRGITAIQAGRYDEGAAALQEADMMYRGRPEALVTLGQLHLQLGRTQEAEASFRDALGVLREAPRDALGPEEVAKWNEQEEEIVLRLAGLLADASRYDEAGALYQEFLARQPDNVMARANLAVVLTRADRAAEAAPIFSELLARRDLDENTLFNIGIGLFRAEQYEPAARAFERAAAAAPYSQVALYNLGQAIYAQAAELEKGREGKADAAAAPINAQLQPLYERMGQVAEQTLALDPANANVLMMLAHSQRGRAEIAADRARADEWRRAAMATLERHEALQFTVSGIESVPGTAEVTVMGRMLNLKAAEGSPLRIRLSLIDAQGATVAQQEVTATAAAAGEPTSFTARIPAPETAVFWKYEILK